MKCKMWLTMIMLACASSLWAQFNFSRFVVTGEAGLARGLNAAGDKYVPAGQFSVQHKIFPNWLFGKFDVGYTNLKAPAYWSRTSYLVYGLVIVPASGNNFYPYLSASAGTGKSVYETGTSFFFISKFGAGTVTRVAENFLMYFGYDYFVGSDRLDGMPRSAMDVNPISNGRYDAFQVFHAGFGVELGKRRFSSSRERSDNEAVRGLSAERELRSSGDRKLKQDEAEDLALADTTFSSFEVDSSDAQKYEADSMQVNSAKPWRVITFAFGESDLSAENKAKLREVEIALRRNLNLRFNIAGHSDSFGNERNNERVSLWRANKVRDYLIARGIDETRLSAEGRGEREPMVDNSSVDAWKNRRVEFWPVTEF